MSTHDNDEGAGPGSTPRGSGAFRFTHPVEVRFRDIDVGGHAHHSQVFVYIEEARWAYWAEVAGRRGVDEVDYILAEGRIRWRARILYPGRLQVGVRVVTVGRSHVEMEYEVRSSDGLLLAEATTVLVMYDYDRGASASVPDELRTRLEAWEGQDLPRRRQR